MNRRLWTALLAALLAGTALAPAAHASVKVDPNSYVPATMTVGDGPKGVAAGVGIGAIADSAANAITYFDVCSPKICQPTNPDSLIVGPNPSDVAIWTAPDRMSGRIIVTLSNNSSIAIVPYNLTSVDRVSIAAPIVVGGEPTGVAVSPEGNLVYVADKVSSNLVVYDLATFTKVALIKVGTGPWGVALNADGTRAYVAAHDASVVTVVDTATRQAIATIPVGAGPGDLALAPSGKALYVTNNIDGTASIIDTATNKVVKTVKVGSQPWGVGVTDSAAFVANYGSGTVSVISTSSREVVATVAAGVNPFGVAVNADQTVMVTNTGSDTLTTIAQRAPVLAATWSSSKKKMSVTGVVSWLPAVTYDMVATKGSTTKHGSCSRSGSNVTCTASLSKGSWKVSITTTLPWQPTPAGKQNKKFSF